MARVLSHGGGEREPSCNTADVLVFFCFSFALASDLDDLWPHGGVCRGHDVRDALSTFSRGFFSAWAGWKTRYSAAF